MRSLAPLNQPIDPTLAQLIQAAAASDSSTPTFFAVGPNGEPNAQFAGKIQAEGIELEERSNQEPQNSIEWKNKAGELRERISGWTNAKETENGPHILELLGFGKASRPAVQVIGHDLENHGVIMLVPGGTGPLAMLYGAEGQSGFSRFVGSGAFGVHNGNSGGVPIVVGPGAEVRVSHGLGVIPYSVQVSPMGNTNVNYSIESPNVANFGIHNQHPSFGAAFFWMAFG